MKTILVSMALLFAVPAFAGGESSAGGADDYQITPAFFLTAYAERPVTICYQVADGFGIEPQALEDMVRKAFQEWADYIPLKRLDIVPSHYMIQTAFELRKSCAGDENLTVYFGVENDLVRKYRTQFSKPFGFAQLLKVETYPDEHAQGLVWIAPSGFVDPQQRIPTWSPSTRDALAGLLLHEMGHVFGNGHVDGTVMTEKIGQYLEADSSPSQSARNVALYSKIDSQIELVPCMECHVGFSAAETFDPIDHGADSASDWVRTFRLLVGKEPVAPLVIRYERLGTPQGSGKLTLMDAMGTYAFPVAVESEIGEHRDSIPLFAGQGRTNFYSFAISYFGKIHTLGGTDLDVAVNYNMDGKKAEIMPLGGEFYPRPIFVSAD